MPRDLFVDERLDVSAQAAVSDELQPSGAAVVPVEKFSSMKLSLGRAFEFHQGVDVAASPLLAPCVRANNPILLTEYFLSRSSCFQKRLQDLRACQAFFRFH